MARPGDSSWAKVLPLSLKAQDVGARRPIVERGGGRIGHGRAKLVLSRRQEEGKGQGVHCVISPTLLLPLKGYLLPKQFSLHTIIAAW